MQLAIATRMSDGNYQMEIDCSESIWWLTPAGVTLFTEASETLIDRHQIRDDRAAVSLDGHFCVTQVAMGTGQEVDSELQIQAARVPRYLQLGLGEKVTGGSRQRLADNTDYAITGVVNHSMIQLFKESYSQNPASTDSAVAVTPNQITRDSNSYNASITRSILHQRQ
ncbi:MAG: hypothetical protein ACPGLY_04605 [Rubripirellula sp.]